MGIMKTTYLVLVLFGLFMVSIAHAGHTLDFHFTGTCPPNGEGIFQCIDIGTGEVVVSAPVKVGYYYRFDIPEGHGSVFCNVRCNGKEVYKKRYEFPGTGIKAVPDYPYPIYRGGDLPKGTLIKDDVNATLRDPSKCGNGEVDAGEACDGSKGCPDPQKPACYDCAYCGCNDAKQCAQISGSMQCGTYGCAMYERPKFGTVCLDGICAHPRTCNWDPECYKLWHRDIEEKQKQTEKQPCSMPAAIGQDEQLRAGAIQERFQGEAPQIPMNSLGGVLSDVLREGDGRTYMINGETVSLTVAGIAEGGIDLTVNGADYSFQNGTATEIDGIRLLAYSFNAPEMGPDGAVYVQIDTVTDEDRLCILLDGDYDSGSGEITWPPTVSGEPPPPPEFPPIEWSPTESEWKPVFPAPPPDEPVEIPIGSDYYDCTAVGKCEIVFGKPGDPARYNRCSSNDECTQARMDYYKRRPAGLTPAGSEMFCFGMACRAILNETTAIGHSCNTNADCGGINLFSSMFGTELRKGMSIGEPLRGFLGNERINFVADGETAFVILENGVVTEAGDGKTENNTVNVITDVETIEAIQMGETSVQEAVHENRIRIEGEGFLNGIRFWFTKVFYDLFYNPGQTDVG